MATSAIDSDDTSFIALFTRALAHIKKNNLDAAE